ncbi:MFS transporter [Orrella sp. NBD-18]|uniref:MFS transporter n=1 Tax=Sheuella amnicola TaxID=2707330 RepID=A0A6B2QX87_9BURK|nr:MFS transporter [Sheuella amnicola]NDY82603.1 MFS transporter [Sheuella amnicola]
MSAPAPTSVDHSGSVKLLLNIGHALDHMFLLIFAASVGVVATDFGFNSWEDLMPYGVGAFIMFGLGSIPSGRLGDLWGRRNMMLIFFIGIGLSALLVSASQTAWQMALALTLVGVFASIYHPVGIPLLVQQSAKPGLAIGVNGLAGNLGVALAAMLTGFLIKWVGWRAAFAVPAMIAIGCGVWFKYACPIETEAPAKRKGRSNVSLPASVVTRALIVMTVTAATGSILFNLTTNGNNQLIAERFDGVINDPALLGTLLAVIYTVASLVQVLVGKMLDHYEIKPIFMGIVLCQIPLLILSAYAEGWWFFAAMLGVMIFIFGAVPFVDVLIVRFIDDHSRSRVAGIRLAVSLGISSSAVWMLGPAVKSLGFQTLMIGMGGLAICTLLFVALLPSHKTSGKAG